MKTLLIALLLSLCTTLAHAAPAKNVLILIGDDHGLDGACFGNPDVDTPNLDRLASHATNFANAFACVSSCSPSRSVILTGMYNHSNGQYGLAHATNNQHTMPGVQSLPRILNSLNYRTALIGKNHVLPKEVYPYQQEINGQMRSATWVAEQTSRIFTDTDPRPFFLVVGFVDPHRAGNMFADKDFDGIERKIYDPELKLPSHLPDDPQSRKDLAAYYSAVNRLDQGIGAVLKKLDESGKADSTLIIYVGDNGRPFPGAKTNLYDPGIHLPMIIRAPRRSAGVVSQAMVSFVDLAPTVLEFIGAKPQAAMAGHSLLPVLSQENPTGWDQVFASHTCHEIWMYYPMRVVRTRTHKLIWNLASTLRYPVASDIARSPSEQAVERIGNLGARTAQQYFHRPEFELYDLEKDQGELHNLADDPGQAKLREELFGRIQKMMKDTKDPWMPILRQKLGQKSTAEGE